MGTRWANVGMYVEIMIPLEPGEVVTDSGTAKKLKEAVKNGNWFHVAQARDHRGKGRSNPLVSKSG